MSLFKPIRYRRISPVFPLSTRKINSAPQDLPIDIEHSNPFEMRANLYIRGFLALAVVANALPVDSSKSKTDIQLYLTVKLT